MKKRWLLIPISISIIAFIVGGVFYFNILDLGQSGQPDLNRSKDTIVNRQLVNAFKTTKTDNKVNFELDQYSLNELFMNSSKELEIKDSPIYVEVNQDKYTFFMDVNYGIIRSRIRIYTSLIEGEDSFIFKIDSINLGNLGAYGFLYNNGSLANLQLEEIFKQSGFNISVDYPNSQFIYLKKDVQSDLYKMMSSKEDRLLNGLVSAIDFTYSPFKAESDLSSNIENKSISDSSSKGMHYIAYSTMLDSIDITLNELHSILTTPIVNQEEVFNNAAKEYFGKLRHVFPETDELNQIIKENIFSRDVSQYAGTGYSYEVAYVSEEQVSNMLITSNIVGKSSTYHDGSNIFYLVIDNFYSDIYSNENGDTFISYTIGLNINGLETRAIIETQAYPYSNDFITDFEVNNVYFGSKVASDSFRTLILDLFEEAIVGMDDFSWFRFNRDNDVMTIDFSKVIKQDPELNEYEDIFYENEGHKEMKINENTVEESGGFVLNYSRD